MSERMRVYAADPLLFANISESLVVLKLRNSFRKISGFGYADVLKFTKNMNYY